MTCVTARALACVPTYASVQVSNWFVNARKRLWEPLLQEDGHSVERFASLSSPAAVAVAAAAFSASSAAGLRLPSHPLAFAQPFDVLIDPCLHLHLHLHRRTVCRAVSRTSWAYEPRMSELALARTLDSTALLAVWFG